MPGLDFKGNLIEMFGAYMPTCFIENIQVEKDYFSVKLALYFEVEEKLETNSMGTMDGAGPPVYEEMVNEDNLHIWLVQTPDRDLAQKIITKEESIMPLAMASYNSADPGALWVPYTELLTDESYIAPLDSYSTSAWPGYIIMYLRRTNCFSMSDFNYETDYPNEERTRRIYKYSMTTDMNFIAPVWDGSASEQTPAEYGELLPLLPENFQSLTIFAFCSTWSPKTIEDSNFRDEGFLNTGFTSGQLTSIAAATEDESMLELSTPVLSTKLPPIPDKLLEREIGNVSYAPIFADGELVDPTILAYVKSDGTPYNQQPLRALTGEYYTTEYMSTALLITDIKNLLVEFEPYYSSVKQLRNIMDAIVITLNTKNETTDLLRELYQMRPLFPSQASSDPTGILYGRFSKRIFRADRLLKKGEIVVKRLLANAKLYDGREDSVPVQYSPSTFGATTLSADGNTEVLYNNALINRVIYGLDSLDTWGDGTAKLVSWGYFFLDIEKLIHGNTHISRYMDTAKVEEVFGRALTNTIVVPVSATIIRKRPSTENPDTSDPQAIMECFFENSRGYPAPLYGKYQSLYSQNTAGTNAWQQAMYDPLDGTASTTIGYSHLAPRAFNTFTPEGGLRDYRLLCMEFEDYREVPIIGAEIAELTLEGGATEPDEFYSIKFVFRDYSSYAMKAIIANYEEALALLEEYYEAAGEACSYDAREDVEVFNQFFIDGMMRTYGDNMDNAPWLRAPAIHYAHKDLLTSNLSGEAGLILTKAQNISNQISPTTGTLSGILDFLTLMREFFDTYYDPNSGDPLNNFGRFLDDIPPTDEIWIEVDIPFENIPEVYIHAAVSDTLSDAATQLEEGNILATWDLNLNYPKVASDIDFDDSYEFDIWPYNDNEYNYEEIAFTWENMQYNSSADASDQPGLIQPAGGTTYQALDLLELLRYLGYDLELLIPGDIEGRNDYVQASPLDDSWYIRPWVFEEIIRLLAEYLYQEDEDLLIGTLMAPQCLSRSAYWDKRNAYRNGYANALRKGYKYGKSTSSGDTVAAAASFLTRILYPNKDLIVNTFNLASKYGAGSEVDVEDFGEWIDSENFDNNAWYISAWLSEMVKGSPTTYTSPDLGRNSQGIKCDWDENRNYLQND